MTRLAVGFASSASFLPFAPSLLATADEGLSDCIAITAMVAPFLTHSSSLQRLESYAGVLERRCLKTHLHRPQVQRTRHHAGVVRAGVGIEDEPEPVDIDLLAKQARLRTVLLTQQPMPTVHKR